MSLPLIFDHVDDLRLPEEAKSFLGFCLNRGSAGPAKIPGKWMRENRERRPSNYWGEQMRELTARQVPYIRGWKVNQSSYEQIPDVRATWFIDPPYNNAAGQHYKFGCRDIDYGHLGHWCRSRSGQVVVCENEGATWLDFSPLGSFKGQRKQSHEVIWANSDERLLLPESKNVAFPRTGIVSWPSISF